MTGGIVVQLVIDTLAAGALYALIALAVSLAYSGSGILHLAVGPIGLAGGLIGAGLYAHGLPLAPAILVGLLTGGALSGAVERGLVEPTLASPLLGAVLLVAAAVVTEGLLIWIFPRPAYAFPYPGGHYSVLGGSVHEYDLVTIGAVLVVAASGYAVLRTSRVGAALRLTATSPRVAERIGVDTVSFRTGSFAVAGLLATGAVLLGAARFPLNASGVVALPFRGIAAAASGRMTSAPVIVVAAAAISAAEVFGGYELGGATGELLCDAVAVVLVAAGWRR